MRKQILVVIGIISAFSITSCTKNKAYVQNCQLYLLVDSTTSLQSVTQFTYDSKQRISEISVTGVKGCRRTFQYINNTVIFNVTDTTPGISLETDTLLLNDKGFIVTQSTYFPSSGSRLLETYLYDDAGVSTGRREIVNGQPGDTLEYVTTNGDLMYETVKGQSTHRLDFVYYPDQNYVYGDPTDFRQQLYYGAYYYKNKHMAKALYSPGKSYREYTYNYQNGRIFSAILKQWTSPGTDTVIHNLSYVYNCR